MISSSFKAIQKPVLPPKGSAFKYKEEGGDLSQKRRQLKKYGLLPIYSLCGWEEDAGGRMRVVRKERRGGEKEEL
jgi:hypothetical protein